MIKNFIKKIIIKILLLQVKFVLYIKKPKILCVVGSVGKTTTKDAIAAILLSKFNLIYNKKSFNSEIGIPLTVLNLENKWNSPIGWIINIFKGFFVVFDKKYPNFLLLEVGIDRPGDMSRLACIIKPDYVIFTWLPKYPVHGEFFDTVDDIYNEKLSILNFIKKEGFVIINADDKIQVEKVKEKWSGKVYFYSKKDCNYEINYLNDNNYLKGITINFPTNEKVIIEGAIGEQFVYPIAAAYKMVNALNLEFPKKFHHKTAPGRLRVLKGIKGTTIIDDSYNASPFAIYSSLETLSKIECRGKKIAVLGEMFELSKDKEIEAYCYVVKKALKTTDILVLIGLMYKQFASENNIIWFPDCVDVFKYLNNIIESGDIILVKGSQGVRLEKIIIKLVDLNFNTKLDIVRQEDEWVNR